MDFVPVGCAEKPAQPVGNSYGYGIVSDTDSDGTFAVCFRIQPLACPGIQVFFGKARWGQSTRTKSIEK